MAVFQWVAKVGGAGAALGWWLACLSACGGSANTDGTSGAGGASGAAGASGASAGSGGGGASGSAGAAGSGGSSGSGAGPGCQVGGCSAELCGASGADLISDCLWRDEYACYQSEAARCERQGDGGCAWTETPALTECIEQARGGVARWYQSCGAPVCGPEDAATGAPPCSAQLEGTPCSPGAAACDPGLGCGVLLTCATSDPRLQPGGCPISRRRFKQDITRLSPVERQRLSQELLRLPLVTYRYQGNDTPPQLGFVIEDVEPSYAVDEQLDRVNLYGYASLAVLALQEQQRTLEAQERRLSEQARQLEALEQRLNTLQKGVRP